MDGSKTSAGTLNREAGSIFALDILYVGLAYWAIDFVFLKVEGILGWPLFLLFEAGLLAAATGLDYGFRKFWSCLPRPAGSSAWRQLAIGALIFAFGFIVIPERAMNMQVSKGFSNLWFAMEFHRFWLNWVLAARASKIFLVLAAASILALIRIKLSEKKVFRALAPALVFSFFALMYWKGQTILKIEDRNLSQFSLPILPAVFFGLFRFNRIYSRFLIGGFLFCYVGVFYFGFLPMKFWAGEPKYPSYVERVYPEKHGESEIVLLFNREMFLTEDASTLYLSYGATCGLADIRLKEKRLAGNIEVKGFMRRIWSREDSNRIYGLDELSSDFHIFTKQPFEEVATVDLFARDRLISPFWFDMSQDEKRLWVITYENNEVLQYRLNGEALELVNRVFLEDIGLTEFSSGGLRVHYDEELNSVFLLLGMVDWQMRYEIAELDADTLAVKRKVLLPEAGLPLIYSPHTKSFFTSSFYGYNLYETDRDTMAVKRTFKGPLSCRSMVYDPKRNLLYASSYANGEFHVIDFPTGKLLHKFSLGPKGATMKLASDGDRLVATSGFGVFLVDLKAMEKALPERPKPQKQ